MSKKGAVSTTIREVARTLKSVGCDKGGPPGQSAQSPIRVVLVSPRYPPDVGGVETHVSEVAKRLAARRAHVTVLTTDPGGRLPRTESQSGVEVRRVRAWPSVHDYYFAPGVYRTVAEGKWDIVHCQGYHTMVAPLAMLAAYRARIPYVVTFHSGGHSSRLRNAIRPIQWAILRPLLARAERLVAVSNFEGEFFQKRLRLPLARFVTIPNGSDLPQVSHRPRADVGGSLILSVGRLERYKGHHRVIGALPKVLESYGDARLRIVGSGPYEAELRALARGLGVGDRVEIGPVPAGDRHSMASLLSSAALTVLMSEYEAHPIAVMEALACGCPVLVAHTSGLAELAGRGFVRSVPLHATPREVAAAIVEQMRRPLMPAELDLPSWDKCATELLTLYGAVLGRPQCAS